MVWRRSGVADTSFDLSLEQSAIVNGHMSKTLDEMWKKEEEEEKVAELLKAKEEEEKQRKMKTCVCGLTYPKGKRKCDSLSCGLSLPNAPNTRNSMSKSMEILKESAVSEKMATQESLGPRFTFYYPQNATLTKKSSCWNSFKPPVPNESVNTPPPATPYIFLDPLDVNPGSEEGVRVILQRIIDESGPDRKIIPIVLDGGPLRLAHKLLRLEPNVYGKILPIPGAGHEELTMLCAFLV